MHLGLQEESLETSIWDHQHSNVIPIYLGVKKQDKHRTEGPLITRTLCRGGGASKKVEELLPGRLVNPREQPRECWGEAG